MFFSITNAESISSTGNPDPTCSGGRDVNNCWDCSPNGWADAGGTPDVSGQTYAASDIGTSSSAGGGATWQNTLPLPPNGQKSWISMRDLGAADTEETVSTTITGLTDGLVYEVIVYSLTALTNNDAPTSPGLMQVFMREY